MNEHIKIITRVCVHMGRTHKPMHVCKHALWGCYSKLVETLLVVICVCPCRCGYRPIHLQTVRDSRDHTAATDLCTPVRSLYINRRPSSLPTSDFSSTVWLVFCYLVAYFSVSAANKPTPLLHNEVMESPCKTQTEDDLKVPRVPSLNIIIPLIVIPWSNYCEQMRPWTRWLVVCISPHLSEKRITVAHGNIYFIHRQESSDTSCAF